MVGPDERLQSVIDALKRAQEAVQCDMTDSYSWCKCIPNLIRLCTAVILTPVVWRADLLGNAHLVHFFEVSHDPEDLKRVQRAYQQAVRPTVVTDVASHIYFHSG